MTDAPLSGVRVVEVSLGTSLVGAGFAGNLPGRLLHDLGAEVAHVRSARRSTLDAGVAYTAAWDRSKDVVAVDDDEDPAAAAATIVALAREADVVVVSGSEDRVERRGLGQRDLAALNPQLVRVRIRPSANALGTAPDLELLLGARAGLTTQIRGRRPGPVFPDLAVGSAGAALGATVGALAGLFEREATGYGSWAETSLDDGRHAILAMITGRVEHHSPSTRLLWDQQGPAETLAYRCADGEYLQLWFGAKGAYESFLQHIGDAPSDAGYMADLVSGGMAERDRRWVDTFATRDRDWWLRDLAGHDFRCEPVLRPGEALRDPHVREIGLSVEHYDPERGTITVLGPVAGVSPVEATGGGELASAGGAGASGGAPGVAAGTAASRLLAGVRVLDLSAYLAGPVATLVLAELGADVVKVEPTTGDSHRGMEPMFAAGQRAKRALGLDLKSPQAPAVLERLFRWSDVVHHNSRVGLAERLGYDEATVRAANPGVVYSHASGFGSHGPRALLPANDQLMQALSGVEAGQGGGGEPPTYLVWGAIDVAGGWVSACAMLAALYRRRRSGGGQSVTSSLLGAGLMLKSGAFVAGDAVESGPVLDEQQTGYGAAYRIYQAADGAWLALAVPDAPTWSRMREVAGRGDLPDAPPPLRTRAGERQPAEEILEAAFRTGPAVTWVAALRAAGVPAELVAEEDRTGFADRVVDDPVNRQLGRIEMFAWGERGRVDAPGFPLRFGPAPRPATRPGIPGLGEHTADVLAAVGVDAAELAALTRSGTVALGTKEAGCRASA